MNSLKVLFCLGISFALVALSAASADEYYALVDFYNSTAGHDWKVQDNWLKTSDYCSWFGVTCDKNGHVTGIFLSANNLQGTIPSSFGSLVHIEGMDVGVNQLRGNLPSSIGNLINAYAFSFRQNQFSGPLPAEMASMVNMQWFHASFNQFTHIPKELKTWNKLKVFGMTGNRLRGTIPDYISEFTDLEMLFLGGNELYGTIPDLSRLQQLVTVDLSENHLSGPVPASIGKLPKLQEFLLFQNNLSGAIPPVMAQQHHDLVVLDAHSNLIAGPLPNNWNDYAHLEYLLLQDNHITGPLPPTLSAIPVVNVSGNHFDTTPTPPTPTAAIASSGKVKVQIFGEQKCPDMASILSVFGTVFETLSPDAVDLEIGYIARPHDSYPLRHWSLHGQTELVGALYVLSVGHFYGSFAALEFANCIDTNQSLIPIPVGPCLEKLNYPSRMVAGYAHSPAAQALLRTSVLTGTALGAAWSPTVYLNGQEYCLWHSAPCPATGPADFVKAICALSPPGTAGCVSD